MARGVNKVILVGNLGRDAETRFTASGVPRTTFTVATSRRWKDPQTGEWRDETEWHNVVLWRQENLAQYLTKGKQVYVEGRLQTRAYDDRDGNRRFITEIVAENVVLLGGRGEIPPEEEAATVGPRSLDEPAAEEPPVIGPDITDDDVPF